MRVTCRKHEGRFSLLEGDYFMFVILISDVFAYTGLAEADMAKVTVALYYVLFTMVTPDNVLGTVTWIHLSQKIGVVSNN